jgi:GST-like protein
MVAETTYIVYLYPSPNTLKVIICLEELGIVYKTQLIDIAAGDQLSPGFAALNPNRKVPVLRAGDLVLFESAAILEYLAERHGGLLSSHSATRWQSKSWLYWSASTFGPMAGQAHHFRCFAPEYVPYAVRRYSQEMNRLYGILEERLEQCEWMCGDYSIVDIALWPWVRHHDWQGQNLDEFPATARWFANMIQRPAVQGAVDRYPVQLIAPDQYKVLLNQTAASLQKPSRELEE